MNVEFRKSFEKDLRNLADKRLLLKVRSLIESIEAADSLDAIANLKKLKAETSYFRIRIGDYRIGLFLEAETLVFIRILHRREFYRYFP